MEIADTQHNTLTISNVRNYHGKVIKGMQVDIPGGLKANMITYGGIITSLQVPDHKGVYTDVVLGYKELESYVDDSHYLGSLVGRFANRIDKGRFALHGAKYHLTQNSGLHHLHGGQQGFNKIVWNIVSFEESPQSVSITLGQTSKDGHEGYPGRLDIQVTFHFTRDSMAISYRAESLKTTIFNPTHHLYFNLSGDFATTVLDHELSINAQHYLPTREDQIPTGEIASVQATPFDFLKPKNIGSQMDMSHPQLSIGNGYDHCFALDKGLTKEPVACAHLFHPVSGRGIEVLSTEPGMQLYTGNYLHDLMVDKHGAHLGKHSGLCLETQHFPDSPNHPHFPSTLLKKGEVFHSTTSYRFTTT